MNVSDEWKGKKSRVIRSSYCDHDKHLLATRSSSRKYERNWAVRPSKNSSSRLGLSSSGYKKDL
jgi:hypothetical protein